MKNRWNKIGLLIALIIGIGIMIVGIISRISGDGTGTIWIGVGALLLCLSIVAISSQRTRSKV